MCDSFDISKVDNIILYNLYKVDMNDIIELEQRRVGQKLGFLIGSIFKDWIL